MRKVAAVCLLLLALACLGARAETEREAYVVSTDDGMPMVVGRDGELIYPSMICSTGTRERSSSP